MLGIGGIWLAAALAAGAGGEDGRAPSATPRPEVSPHRSASARARALLSLGSDEEREETHPGKYQTDLPGDEPAGHASPPAQPHSSGDSRGAPRGGYQTELPRERPPPTALSLGPLELLLRILGWTGLGVLAVLLAVWLSRAVRTYWSRRHAGDAAVVDDPRTQRPVAIPIGDAEAFAARGSYGEAVHALLLRTLEALSRAARLSPALTSREIVTRVELSPRARLALRGLVYAVEVSRFGGAAPGEEEYRACRERFEEFLATYGRPA